MFEKETSYIFLTLVYITKCVAGETLHENVNQTSDYPIPIIHHQNHAAILSLGWYPVVRSMALGQLWK